MIVNGVRVLLLGMIVGCQPVRSEAPATAVTPEPPVAEPPVAEKPVVPAPKVEVVVRNMGPSECKVALAKGTGDPGIEPTILPVGTTKIAMTKEEGLAVQNPEGKYGTWGSTDGEPGEIVVHGRCRTISVAESFTAARLATMAPHVVASCCGACNEQGCTDCSDVKAGTKCKGKQAIATMCSLYDDVFDCVPATAVEADGVVKGEYAFRRLTEAK